MIGIARRFAVVTALVAIALGGVSTVAAHDDRDDLEVRVAKLVNGRCGQLTQSLPALISRSGIRPGDVVGDVTVCVENHGDDTALLSLRVSELVDVDPTCSATEPTRDSTCGGGKKGELGPSLLQEVGLRSCPSAPPDTSRSLDRRLPALQVNPLTLVDRLRRKEVVCVRLRLRYDPPDANAAIASQSDRTLWRYGFTVTERH